MSTQKILVIDDDSDIGEFICAAAHILGWHCKATSDPAFFLENLASDPNVIFLDLVMPEMDGVELLRLLGRQRCEVGIVLMSGIGKRLLETADELAQALGLTIVGHLQKPFQIKDLEEILARPRVPAIAAGVSPKKTPLIHDEELRGAIDREEFVLHYQPQIGIRRGNVVGIEALVRWQHPEHGLIFPDDFIGRLEALGLIEQLGWLAATCGFSDVGRFIDESGFTPVLSVNISVRSLHNLAFPDMLVSLAKTFSVPAEKVTIEITESGLIKELTTTLDVATRLRMKRVGLSIDDFGTGYSMMGQLRHIPATELKIDKSFVQHMQFNAANRVMVQKTIEIGHELGMQVVAEGVETAEQLELLRAYGCDIAQGYLYSRPLAADDFLAWLKKYRLSLCG